MYSKWSIWWWNPFIKSNLVSNWTFRQLSSGITKIKMSIYQLIIRLQAISTFDIINKNQIKFIKSQAISQIANYVVILLWPKQNNNNKNVFLSIKKIKVQTSHQAHRISFYRLNLKLNQIWKMNKLKMHTNVNGAKRKLNGNHCHIYVNNKKSHNSRRTIHGSSK